MVARLYLINAVVVQFGFSAIRAQGPTLPLVWGAFLAYQVLRASEFGLRLLWNQRNPQRIRRKRELWTKVIFVWARRKLAGRRDERGVGAAGPVWTSSYEARKYSTLSYDI